MKKYVTLTAVMLMAIIGQTQAKWQQRSKEAIRLLTYLEENVGRKMLTGTMANVNYNTYEADWVYRHTGKYPTMNCFDYMHAQHSQKGGWIDYSDTTPIVRWSDAGGIVAAMWHWNQRANGGQHWSFHNGTEPKQTSFSPSAIFHPESEGYKRMMADIDQVAEWMKPLAEQGIPIIWRPLHEAQGNWSEQFPNQDWPHAWFWWGADGPEAFVELWKVMYDRMVNRHGLKNLIWVLTVGDSKQWYPGDEYVDIVVCDCYNRDMEFLTDIYQMMHRDYPGKLVALGECGNVPKLSEQWKHGLHWSYFMPWYDYKRTNNPQSEAFDSTSHFHFDISFWQDALDCNFIVTRDELPSLR